MFFKKKDKKAEATAAAAAEEADDGEKKALPEDASLVLKVSQMEVELTKISATLGSFKEINKSTTERFGTVNEQIGELRGQITDSNRTLGMIEVKATKAADLVESVHPDKLMIQVQKEDGKIEGLRAQLEAKETMMQNIMDQLRTIRNQINVFKGVEQVIGLNEEVKDEIMNVKKIAAFVEQHSDKVENVFIESQKTYREFNDFASMLELLKSELKDANEKIDKISIKINEFMTKKDAESRIGKIENDSKKMKGLSDEMDKEYRKFDSKFKELRKELVREFDRKIAKAEIMSNAFEETMIKNPMFAEGLGLKEYLKKMLEDREKQGAVEAKEEKKEAPKEEKKEDKKEDKKEEKKDAKK